MLKATGNVLSDTSEVQTCPPDSKCVFGTVDLKMNMSGISMDGNNFLSHYMLEASIIISLST